MKLLTGALTAYLAYLTVHGAATWPIGDALILALVGFCVCLIGLLHTFGAFDESE